MARAEEEVLGGKASANNRHPRAKVHAKRNTVNPRKVKGNIYQTTSRPQVWFFHL